MGMDEAAGGQPDPVTLVGLLLETATGLKRIAGPHFEQEHCLPVQSFEVLVRLARSPESRLRMSELAAQTSLTPSGLTRAIDRLEQSGLACRLACPEDGRGAFAALTPSGTEKMAAALSRHRQHLEEVFSPVLDARERQLLTTLLRRLRDQVNPQAAKASPT